MEDSKHDYHISFFKPTTAHATSNRNMVIWFVLIWAVAIFGFQVALLILEKPTPEPVYGQFESVWQQVKHNDAKPQDLQVFSYAALSVLGKVFIAPQHRLALDEALTWSVLELADSAQKLAIQAKIEEFQAKAGAISDIQDPAYMAAKDELSQLVSPLIGLEKNDVRTRILPLELVAVTDGLSTEDINLIEESMSLYLIHNRSVLTDTKFLGFPFHYFYTAIFLLILFVVLCWLYCVRTDRINAKLNIAD